MDSEQVRYLFYHELTHITTTFCVPGCRGISLNGEILVTYSGAFAASKEVNDRFNNGEVIASKDEYFITAPQFTTGSKKYEWLNQIQAVGKMVSIQRGVKIKYDWFIVR